MKKTQNISCINNNSELTNVSLMKEALALAHKAFNIGEVPIGALVINSQGKVIGRGYNQVEKQGTQLAHAEILALRKAAKQNGDWRLSNCWLYVTLEPCHMCMGLIRLSRLQGVLYGARSPLFGYSLDNQLNSRVYKNDKFFIMGGILAPECEQLLKKFFAAQRQIKDKKC